jgi:hypothetical protein
MMHRTVWALAALLTTATLGQAQVKNGELRLPEGAELFSPIDSAFRTVGDDGLTVEGWFWLDEMPEEDHIMTFFEAAGAYSLAFGFARPVLPGGPWFEPGTPIVFGGMTTDAGWGVGFHSRGDTVSVQKWFHIALQFHSEPPEIISYYIHGDRRAFEAIDGDAIPYGFNPGRGLQIGDSAFKRPNQKYNVRTDTRSTAWLGAVDSIRVSDVVRYTAPWEIGDREFRNDAHTIALWTFDDRNPFADASGNGQHLQPEGILAVEAGAKLAATWGAIKGVTR